MSGLFVRLQSMKKSFMLHGIKLLEMKPLKKLHRCVKKEARRCLLKMELLMQAK